MIICPFIKPKNLTESSIISRLTLLLKLVNINFSQNKEIDFLFIFLLVACFLVSIKEH